MKLSRQFVLCSIALVSALTSGRNSPAPSAAERAVNAIQYVHDPCIVKEGATYYVYSTGPGIPIRRSKDLIHWELSARVFEGDGPEWIRKEVPASRGMWAPDVSFHAGRFHLTYAVSSFGSNRSIIGAASNKTLEPASKDYHWEDDGKVFESTRWDNYNAIDPNILPLANGRLALTFGSFWSGIKLVFLDAKTGKPARDAAVLPLARRPSPDAIEAPFLIRRGRYYYLFVSFDYCCRGVNSTYNIRVGRSEAISGPYLDKEGKSMMEAGGTQILGTEGARIGPGHCAILHDAGKDYLAYHYYDGAQNGIPTLQISPISWSPDAWPAAGPPFATPNSGD